MQLKAGDKAPYFEADDTEGRTQTPRGDGKRPVLLTFFRHAGCPMCNLRTRELIRAQEDIARRRLQLLSVFESSVHNIRRDVGKQNPPFPIIPDRERRLYKLYGVAPSWRKFPRIFISQPSRVYEAIVRNGFFPKFAEATPMMPAEFLIAPDGEIKLVYYGNDIGDHLPLPDLFEAVDRLEAQG